jgi:hypothetical protein
MDHLSLDLQELFEDQAVFWDRAARRSWWMFIGPAVVLALLIISLIT